MIKKYKYLANLFVFTLFFLIILPAFFYSQKTDMISDTVLAQSTILSTDPNVKNPFTKDAYRGLITCEGGAKNTPPASVTGGKRYSSSGLPICDFGEVIRQINHLINFAFKIILPIIFCIILWAGFLFLTGKPGDRDKAKNALQNIVIGIFWMAAAFLVIKLILSGLAESYSSFFLDKAGS